MIRNRLGNGYNSTNRSNSGNNLECSISIGKGDKGDPFTFNDFTEEQLELLRGEKGESFKYEDFTEEQLEALKGAKGDAFTFDDFTSEQLELLRGEKGEAFTYEDFTEDQLNSLKGERGKDFTYEDFTSEQLESLKGDKGDKGDKGEAFTFDDFTSEQLENLKGAKGDAFTYEDFTEDQLESLKGSDGKSVELNKSDTHIQYRPVGDEDWVDLVPLEELKVREEIIDELLSQIHMLTERVVALEEGAIKPPEVPQAPTFLGLISPFKDISNITFDDLNVDTVERNIVSKPQAIYAHKAGTQFNKSCVIAIPKTFGTITGVVDGADISITGSYHWKDVTLNIPNIGDVEYIIGGNIKAQAYNNSSVVKWNLA